MARIAILDDMLPVQLRHHSEGIEGLELVWSGNSVDSLERELDVVRPDVVIASLELLGENAGERLSRWENERGVELTIVLYQFARRSELARMELPSGKRRTVRKPLSVERLRAQMMSVLVRGMLSPTEDSGKSASRPEPPGTVQARRYSTQQLAQLLEINSAVECECPNHLAQIVGSLAAFEEYSARCESKNDADVEVHRALHLQTARARAVMEDALARLLEFENIRL